MSTNICYEKDRKLIIPGIDKPVIVDIETLKIPDTVSLFDENNIMKSLIHVFKTSDMRFLEFSNDETFPYTNFQITVNALNLTESLIDCKGEFFILMYGQLSGVRIVSKNENNDSTDNVNHPSHYTSHPSGIECIEITKYYDFCIGNAIKYLWRAGLKKEDGMTDSDKEIEDLKKAVWYINKKISMLKEEQGLHD